MFVISLEFFRVIDFVLVYDKVLGLYGDRDSSVTLSRARGMKGLDASPNDFGSFEYSAR